MHIKICYCIWLLAAIIGTTSAAQKDIYIIFDSPAYCDVDVCPQSGPSPWNVTLGSRNLAIANVVPGTSTPILCCLLPLDMLKPEKLSIGQLQTISIDYYRQAYYGIAQTRLIFDYLHGFAFLDNEANIVYADNTTETSTNIENAILDTTDVLSKTYNIPAGSIPQSATAFLVAYSVLSRHDSEAPYVTWHNATARLQFESSIVDATNEETKLALGLGISIGVGGFIGLAIMTVFLVRLKKREKRLKRQNANNNNDSSKTVEMVGTQRSVSDMEEVKKSSTYTSMSTGTSPNNTTTGTGSASVGAGGDDMNYVTCLDVNSGPVEFPPFIAQDLARSGSLQDRFNIPYKAITFKSEIGTGGFGRVFMGEWQSTEVAIKVSHTIAAYAEFRKEAELMVNIRPHPNVLQVLGVSTDGVTPAIIMEYCPGGSLDTMIKDPTKQMTPEYQFRLILGIARGMLHLHKNNIVHRDLAARNILLSRDGEPKISDFGMSRIIESTIREGTTRTNFGPVRWMAPESLKDKKYSTKSDVWMFGIVLSEILNREEPHKKIKDTIEVAVQIRTNFLTPEIPDDTPLVISEIMKQCWSPDPEDRPEMEQICEKLLQYKEQNKLIRSPSFPRF